MIVVVSSIGEMLQTYEADLEDIISSMYLSAAAAEKDNSYNEKIDFQETNR